jgi:uncharacterized membrane protein YeaQ/YmgE (transglycosylase-associated protein family)
MDKSSHMSNRSREAVVRFASRPRGNSIYDTTLGKGDTMIGAIVLGVVAGYIGRLLMPGRDKMGFIMTVLLGLAGSVVGFLVFTELLGIGDNKMFDLGGLIGAIVGVMILLALYRVALKNKEHPLAR